MRPSYRVSRQWENGGRGFPRPPAQNSNFREGKNVWANFYCTERWVSDHPPVRPTPKRVCEVPSSSGLAPRSRVFAPQSYYHHLRSNKTSMLMRIFGLYHFVLPGRSVWGIVIGNVLQNPLGHPVTDIFDLKGRQPKAGKFGKNPGQRVIKDNEITRRFHLPDQTRRRFFEQLDADVLFLEAHNFMDYSVLIGVVPDTSQQPHPPDLHAERPGTGCVWMAGGSRSAPELYMVGIIDCLTRYTAKKAVAHFCKTFLWNTPQLSTVKPGYYASRIKTYMQHMVEAPCDAGALPGPSSGSQHS